MALRVSELDESDLVIGYPGGQDDATLPVRNYALSYPQEKFPEARY